MYKHVVGRAGSNISPLYSILLGLNPDWIRHYILRINLQITFTEKQALKVKYLLVAYTLYKQS